MSNGTIHISPPRYGTQTELSPDLSSHKVYCAKARDYISPGSFVLISASLSVFQILLVLPSTSNEVPEIVQERAALDTRSQVLKLLTYKRASQLAHTHSITPLCQRAVCETVEVVKTNEITYALNTSIDSICFGFHVDSLISGENYCNGIGNTFMIRQHFSDINSAQLEPITSESFSPFSSMDSTNNFSENYSSNYSHQVWTGVCKIRETINSLMCQRNLGQGMSFCQCKSLALNLSSATWSYLCSKVKEESELIKVHTYKRNARKALLRYGLLLESIIISKTWHHIRFETSDDFDVKKKCWGQYHSWC